MLDIFMFRKIHPIFQIDHPFIDNDSVLMHKVLTPYRSKQCEYLKSSRLQKNKDLFIGQGQFSISTSCYIDDTGHFNSVEFNICYNQLFYYIFAKSIKENLLDELSHWNLADYWHNQLPNILITHFSSKFKQPINSQHFSGEIIFTRIKQRKVQSNPALFIQTTARFWDNANGYSEGNVNLMVIKHPHEIDIEIENNNEILEEL